MASKKESTLINMLLTLFLVSAVAALALGAVYEATKGPIQKAKTEKLNNAIGKVLPNPVKVDPVKKVDPIEGKDQLEFYKAYDKEGKYIGTAIKTYTDKGFSGRFTIMVGFLPDGTIHNTAVLEHKETPGLGDKMDVSKGDFPNQFEGKNPQDYQLIVSKDGGDVDAITAATISSRAFCDAVQRAYDSFIKEGGAE